MSTKEETNKLYPELLQKCNKEDDKASEIKQIESEQRLIVEQMIRLELQRKRFQNILNVLQTMDSDDDEDQST